MQTIQLASISSTLFALGDDGSIWQKDNAFLDHSPWRPVVLPPGTRPTGDVPEAPNA